MLFRPAKSKRRSLILGSIFLIAAGIGAYFFLLPQTSDPIATTAAMRGRFQVSIKVSGEIRAANSFTMTAPRGRFSQTQVVFLVPEGRTVQAGDTVVRFATTDIDKIITERESELTLLTSDYKKLQADQDSRMLDLKSALRTAELAMDQAKLQVEKVRFESDVARKEAEINFERSKLNLEQAKRRISSQIRVDQSEDMKARQKLRQTELDLEKARTERDQLIMKAPMPGLVVYEMNWQTGRKIAIGDAPWAGMALMSLPDLSKMQTISSVNEVDISKVRAGQQAIVKLDAFPERAFNATVVSVGTIGQLKERASNNKTFEVVLDIAGNDPILKPGMTTSNEIVMAVIPDAVYLPLESVFESDGSAFVYRMQNGTPVVRKVTLGQRNSNFVVVEKGIASGDLVTLRDPNEESTAEPSAQAPEQKTKQKQPRNKKKS